MIKTIQGDKFFGYSTTEHITDLSFPQTTRDSLLIKQERLN